MPALAIIAGLLPVKQRPVTLVLIDNARPCFNIQTIGLIMGCEFKPVPTKIEIQWHGATINDQRIGTFSTLNVYVIGIPDNFVVACATVNAVGTFAAIKIIITGTAEQGVIACPAKQIVIGVIADQNVVARSRNCIFNDRIAGNNHIAGQTKDAGNRFGTQINMLVVGLCTKIYRINAAIIVNRERDGHGIILQILQIHTGVGIFAVSCVAGICCGWRAVQVLNCNDIGDHWRHHISAGRIHPGIFDLMEIRHHGCLP